MEDRAARLLDWYDANARVLPWRALPGEAPDPYRVWLSEIMLQQTRAAAAAPYFEAFARRWPTLEALAAATLEEVMAAWAGLGYYARARNLHRCAQEVAAGGGRLPRDEAALRALPGIGPYTAAAIAAIAFGQPSAAVDGNVERVMARLFAVTEPLPKSRPRLRALAGDLVPGTRTGDFAQALIELGATVCTPRAPNCSACPLAPGCEGRRSGTAETLPHRTAKPARPTRFGVCFWLVRDGAALLRRRPPSGLLGGMMEVPGTPWRGRPWPRREALAFAPAKVRWHSVPGEVSHPFTHFQLALTVLSGRTATRKADGIWVPVGAVDDAGLPSVMARAAHLVAHEETAVV